MEKPDFLWIDHNAALEKALPHCAKVKWLAVDTEADSLHHYFEKVCLIQITADERNFIVDPLSQNLDLTPLLAIFREKPLIFHGADYDLRMLRQSFDLEPEGELFDTMLAAQLLGYNQFGLGALVERFFEVTLPKEGQKWDWSRRPLDAKHLAYAANDTVFLPGLAAKLKEELERLGRRQWLREACEKARATAQQDRPVDPDRVWRIKGSGKMVPREMAFLRGFWLWRDEQAQNADLPPFKILNNEKLLELSRWIYGNPGKKLDQWEKLPRNLRGRRLFQLQKIADEVERLPEPQCPKPLRPEKKRPGRDLEAEKRFGDIRSTRDKRAAKLELEPSVLAPKNALLTIARECPTSPESMEEMTGLLPWQCRELYPLFAPSLKGPDA